MKRKLPDRRAAAKRAALRALRKTEAAAAKAGVTLSEWEGEFLGSVAERVKTYGRAFGDPEKGSDAAALSVRQTLKLKQIRRKVNEQAAAPRPPDEAPEPE